MVKTVGANRSVGAISDALHRKLARVPSGLPILHAVRGEFRDAVTEIHLPCAVTVRLHFNATIRKFRIVALEAIRGMKGLIAQRKPQPVVRNKKGLA